MTLPAGEVVAICHGVHVCVTHPFPLILTISFEGAPVYRSGTTDELTVCDSQNVLVSVGGGCGVSSSDFVQYLTSGPSRFYCLYLKQVSVVPSDRL